MSVCNPLRPQVSAQLFTTHRQYHEGQLTKRKELVVANIHLAQAAVKVGCGGSSSGPFDGHSRTEQQHHTSGSRSTCCPLKPRVRTSSSTGNSLICSPPPAACSWGWSGACVCCPSACRTGPRPRQSGWVLVPVASLRQHRLFLHAPVLLSTPAAAGTALSTPALCTPASGLQKSSKVLADAMEALLGAFLVAGGYTAALAFLQASCMVCQHGSRVIDACCWLLRLAVHCPHRHQVAGLLCCIEHIR